MKEVEEPFGRLKSVRQQWHTREIDEIERICALARYVIVNALNPAITASTQWFERTLDDSANKRISIPEGFLAVDAILGIYINITDGLVVYLRLLKSIF